MARFTKIPETNLAGALGGIVGQVAGTVIGTGNIAITKLQGTLDSLCEEVTSKREFTEEDLDRFEKTLDKIEATIDTLNTTISAVETTAEGLNTVLTAIAIPVAALKVAINIVKYLPLPQIWLVTSVSALQADLIQMLSELVAQIEQIVLTLLIIIKIILALLKKLKDLLTKLRKVLAALRAWLALQRQLSDQDQEVLEDLGVLNPDGTNIFGRLAGSINNRLTDIIWVGDYKTIDTGSVIVENQVKAAESGTTVRVSVGAVGNWIAVIYKASEEKPERPASRDLLPEGWVDSFKGECWSSRGTVSGLTNKISSWTEPVRSLGGRKQEHLTPETKDVNVFRMSAGKFAASKFNMQEANAIILTSDEAYGMMLGLLQDLDQAPLSQDLKDQLCTDINPQEDQSDPENTDEWYIARNGDKYLMTLKASTTSPKIATRRYVQVTDMSGTIVYEGTQTFATDPKVLFDETRVRLTQLLG